MPDIVHSIFRIFRMFIVIWKLVRRHSLIDCVHRPGAGRRFRRGSALPQTAKCVTSTRALTVRSRGDRIHACKKQGVHFAPEEKICGAKSRNGFLRRTSVFLCWNNGAAVRPCIYLAGPVIQNPLAAVIYRPPAIACFCTARIACRFLRQLKISVHFPLSLCLPHPAGDNFFPCFPTSFLSIPEQHSAGEKPFHKNGCAGRGGVSASRPAHACPRAFVTNRSNSSVCGAPAPPNERELCR